MGGDSLVGMETRYGLEVRGSNTGEGEIFRTRPDRPWAHPASCTVRAGYWPGVKRPERGVNHPPHVPSRLKEG